MNWTAHTFSVGGVIAGLRDTTPDEPRHPALMLVVEVGDQYARIVIPPAVWPAPREFLEIGRFVGVSGLTDSYPLMHQSQQVATEVRFGGTHH
jgi:hypothetical protein